jgi:hypothetical protein
LKGIEINCGSTDGARGGTFRMKLFLAGATATIALILSLLTGWAFMFVWYMTAMLNCAGILCACAIGLLWNEYRSKRH